MNKATEGDHYYGIKGRFLYEPDTGRILHRRDYRRHKSGDDASYLRKDGRLVLQHEGREYQAHRAAWFLHYGRWPEGDVDHIDGDPSNNRIANLREATRSQNLGNAKLYRNNKSGHRGVFYVQKHGYYIATIQIRKRVHHLGSFKNKEDAAAAYERAAQNGFGGFARCVYEMNAGH